MHKWLVLLLILFINLSLAAQEETLPPKLTMEDYQIPPMELDPLLENWFEKEHPKNAKYISGGLAAAAFGSFAASCWYTLDAAAVDPYSDEVQKGLILTGGSAVLSGLTMVLFDFIVSEEE